VRRTKRRVTCDRIDDRTGLTKLGQRFRFFYLTIYNCNNYRTKHVSQSKSTPKSAGINPGRYKRQALQIIQALEMINCFFVTGGLEMTLSTA
jgi:5-keto 4-deoxyuronate isomerase